MNEKTAWQRFETNGSVADYLEYKNCVNSKAQESETELKTGAQNNCTGTRNTGADRRGVR